jgi:hypothetical protein
LREKEGLALINGTDGMLGMLVLAITDLRDLLKVVDLTAAMSVEGLLGTDNTFAADLQALRPPPGPGRVGVEPTKDPGREPDPGQPRQRGLHQGSGRLFAEVRTAGGRRRS